MEVVSPKYSQAEADVIDGVMIYTQGVRSSKISADLLFVNRHSLIVLGVSWILQ